MIKLPIDRVGTCPHCLKSWDGGDIRQVLASLDVNEFKKAEEVDKLASNYGWTKDNGKKFSRTKSYEINVILSDSITLLECQDCFHVFNEETCEEYESVQAAKQALFVTKE